jgi:prepilin-type N-terminal cleavage/methylation domain-containing protein
MNIFNLPSSKGFTLIETLFAILIFSAALVSLLTISSKGISATNQVKNETTAYYLAQEGLEVVRNVRDSNFLQITGGSASVNWTDGFASTTPGPDCVSAANGCYIVYGNSTPPILDINTANSSQISLAANGQFSNSGTDTGFKRIITITAPSGSRTDEYMVTSTVTWQAKNISRSVELQTILKKWQ